MRQYDTVVTITKYIKYLLYISYFIHFIITYIMSCVIDSVLFIIITFKNDKPKNKNFPVEEHFYFITIVQKKSFKQRI